MANKQIKITGDTKDLKKSIMDLSKTVTRTLGRSRIELFSPETKKLLRGQVLLHLREINREIKSTREEMERQNKLTKKMAIGSNNELRSKKQLLEQTRRLVNLEKQRVSLRHTAGDLRGRSAAAPSMPIGRRGRTGGRGRWGGPDRAMRAVLGYRGAAMLSNPYVAGGLAIGGAALYGGSRVKAGYETFSEGISDRIGLMGRGLSTGDMTPQYGGKQLGQAGLTSLSLRRRMLQSRDVFGAGGSSQQEVYGRARFERGMGLQGGTLMGMGGQLRQTMGGAEANKSIKVMMASAIAEGVNKSEIVPYMETASGMLTDLNERGFTFDNSAMSLFASLVSRSGQAERSGRLMSGKDAGIRGATGEAAALFQYAFHDAGIGGGTIGGAQAAMRMGGLFGFNPG